MQNKSFLRLGLLCGMLGVLIFAVIYVRTTLLVPRGIVKVITLSLEEQAAYIKAWEQRVYPPEFSTDDNGYRVFIRQFGDAGHQAGRGEKPENREFYRLQLYEKLGLDPTEPPAFVMPDSPDKIYYDFYEAKGGQLPVSMSYTSPWTLDEYPMFTDWINEIDAPMDVIAEAIHKPVFFLPTLQSLEPLSVEAPEDVIDIPGNIFSSLRDVARIFTARANYRIGRGDIDGAIADKLTVYRLGRQITQKESSIRYHVGFAVELLAISIPINANPEHPIMVDHIRRLLEGFDALPPRASLWEGAEDLVGLTQRLECAENMQRLVLAILLYRLENGKMPDENWATQIEKYLGENPERYFSCPSNPSPKGATTYFLIQYGDEHQMDSATPLLFEAAVSCPLRAATLSFELSQELAHIREQQGEKQRRGRHLNAPHAGGSNVAFQSGIVRTLSWMTEEEQQEALLRMIEQAFGSVE